jgi:hypothetical protein
MEAEKRKKRMIIGGVIRYKIIKDERKKQD